MNDQIPTSSDAGEEPVCFDGVEIFSFVLPVVMLGITFGAIILGN